MLNLSCSRSRFNFKFLRVEDYENLSLFISWKTKIKNKIFDIKMLIIINQNKDGMESKYLSRIIGEIVGEEKKEKKKEEFFAKYIPYIISL